MDGYFTSCCFKPNNGSQMAYVGIINKKLCLRCCKGKLAINKMQYIQNGQFLSVWKYSTKEKPLKFYFSRNGHQGIWKFNLHLLDNTLNICHYKTIFQAYAIMFMVLSDNLWLVMPMAGLVPAHLEIFYQAHIVLCWIWGWGPTQTPDISLWPY
jgi:hypothetical protein